MGKIEQGLAGSLIVGMGIVLLYHFVRIYNEGEVYIYETNRGVLVAEMGLMTAITLYGLYKVLSAAKQG